MDEYETSAKYNLAETCCASISVNDLIDLAVQKPTGPIVDFSQKLTYGTIPGSEALRRNVAGMHADPDGKPLPPTQVLITAGAIAANFQLLYALIGPGDHVICQYPTYQQLYSVPESLGAEVSLWKSREDDGWSLSLDELETLIRPNTKLIIIKYVVYSPTHFHLNLQSEP